MQFDGAIGYLIGEAHQGLKYMLTMMNNARLSVGLQGVAVADAAYQHAAHYAADRVQGKDFKDGERVSIDQHPDVKRNLLTMRSQIEAGRALVMQAALGLDAGDTALVDLLTPIVKSWCTDMAVEVTSIGVQIHGGMGFIEETGAAQFLRDARILPIGEGTNGIQAADLIFRKVLRDGGAVAFDYIDTHIAPYLADEAKALKEALEALLADGKNLERLTAAQPLLKAFGIIAGGALLARSVSALTDQPFAKNKRETADFFASISCRWRVGIW